MKKSGQVILDAGKIAEQIPHRYPFLFLDRIVEQSPGRCVAVKNVTFNEWYFQGHFPEMPVMPGCLLAEAMAQAGNFIGRLQDSSRMNQGRIKEAFLLSSETKFIKPVVPGDQLVITASLIRKDGNVIHFKSEAYVSEKVVARGRFVAMAKEEDEP